MVIQPIGLNQILTFLVWHLNSSGDSDARALAGKGAYQAAIAMRGISGRGTLRWQASDFQATPR